MHFIVNGQFSKFRTQSDQCNQIWDGHQAVDQFCKRPDESCLQYRTEYHHNCLQQHKKIPAGRTEKELGTSGTVQSPPKYRGKSEAAKGSGQEQGHPVSIYGGECLRRQCRACVLPVRNRNTAAKDHQRSHGADHDGIQKYLHDPHQPLSGRMFHLCSSVGNGCGAHARLIGKNAAGNSDAQCLKAGTDNAACNRPG